MENTDKYLEQLTPSSPVWAEELEKYAKEHNVPIMDKASMQFILQLVRMQMPDKILEIGTAIGYSALRMLEASENQAQIITLEKDEQRYQLACDNIEKNGGKERVRVIQGDALETIDGELKGETFNFVFIDAAKGQYRRYFDRIDPLVPAGGVVVTDNVLFKGYVADDTEVPKRIAKMVERIQQYNEYLMHHEAYTSTLIPIGDGVMVSYKNK